MALPGCGSHALRKFESGHPMVHLFHGSRFRGVQNYSKKKKIYIFVKIVMLTATATDQINNILLNSHILYKL